MSKLILPKEPQPMKPCPFCGCTNIGPETWYDAQRRDVHVCPKCEATATENWWNNRRHPPDEVKGFSLSREEYEHLQRMFMSLGSHLKLPNRFEEEVKELRAMIERRTGICYPDYT